MALRQVCTRECCLAIFQVASRRREWWHDRTPVLLICGWISGVYHWFRHFEWFLNRGSLPIRKQRHQCLSHFRWWSWEVGHKKHTDWYLAWHNEVYSERSGMRDDRQTDKMRLHAYICKWPACPRHYTACLVNHFTQSLQKHMWSRCYSLVLQIKQTVQWDCIFKAI